MQIQVLSGMTLTAHDRAFPIFEVTALAVHMKRPSQTRLPAGRLLIMALRATLVLGRLIFQFFSIFINMVAFTAILYFSQFIVLIMAKNDRGSLFDSKATVIDHFHILL